MSIDWEALFSPFITFILTNLGGKMLLNYFQKQKIPTLVFETFTKTDSQLEPIYFVRIRNSEGEGKAKKCVGKLDINNNHIQTVWATQSNKCDILQDSREDLRLFRIEYEKIISPIQEKLIPKIIFIPTLKPKNLRKQGEIFDESPKSFEDYRDSDITIRIDAERGKPTSLTKKISEIIDEAKVERT